MNCSLQDGLNIGWKLALVLKGQSDPELLKTYDLERGKVAKDLIDFDRYFTKLFSSKPSKDANGSSADHFKEQFIKSGRYTAGLTATYDDSMLTCAGKSTQVLATNLIVGMRFPSAQVVRHCDAKAMQLVKALPADGRWRIVVFAGEIAYSTSATRLGKVGAIAIVNCVRVTLTHVAAGRLPIITTRACLETYTQRRRYRQFY